MFILTPIKADRLRTVYRKKKLILRKEGFLSLLKNIFLHFISCLFHHERYFLYEYSLNSSMHIPVLPCKVDNLEIRPIWVPISLEEYELLGDEGFDFRTHAESRDFKEATGNGTIVFCTFRDNELVNRTGMTTYRNGVYKYVYPSFTDDVTTAYAGFSETKEKYRYKGVYTYVHSEIYRYLKKNGFVKVILLEAEEQIGPRKVQDRLGAKVLYNVDHFRLFFLANFWLKRT